MWQLNELIYRICFMSRICPCFSHICPCFSCIWQLYPFQFQAMRSKILRSWHNATAKLHSLSWYCCAVLICTISRKIFYQIWCPSGKLSYRNYDPSTLSEILVSNSPLPPEFPVLPVGGYGYIFWDYTMQKMKFN